MKSASIASAAFLFVPSVYAWQFAVISDVHVFQSGKVPSQFRQTVAELVSRKPRFVIVDGDSTSGNPDDGFDASTVDSWWQEFQSALEPLRKAGIAVFSVAGNHDYYTDVHREAYLAAWSRLGEAPWPLSGNAPRFYSFDVDGVHLSMLHVVDQAIDGDVEAWLKKDLASPQAANAKLRLAFGHVPLSSVIGHTNGVFESRLGQDLLDGKVAAYISGHEHLVWDQELAIGGRSLRQISVGTASGTYTYPVRPELAKLHCQGASCTMPGNGLKIAIDPATRLEKEKVSFLLVDVSPAGGFAPHALGLESSGHFAVIGE